MSHPKKPRLSWILVVVLVLENPDGFAIRLTEQISCRTSVSLQSRNPNAPRTSTTNEQSYFGQPDPCGRICSISRRRILFKLRQRGIHLVPRVRVACPDIYLWIEPARIIQARRPDRDNVRGRVGIALDRRAAIRAKAPTGLSTHLTGRGM